MLITEQIKKTVTSFITESCQYFIIVQMKIEICIMSLNKGVRFIIKIVLYHDKYHYLVKKLPILVCETYE